MSGSTFVTDYARRGLAAWEARALELARTDGLTPWPFVNVTVVDGDDTLVLPVQSDVLAVGTLADHVRLPLTPGVAQSIANLSGSLLPTPWLEYVIWRSAALKLPPTAMVPNQGANLEQYAAHSHIIDGQIADATRPVADVGLNRALDAERYAHQTGDPNAYLVAGDAWQDIGAPVVGGLVSGIKKGVVVANFYKPGKVLLFGWYRPSPDVFDDGKPMGVPDRQPIQPRSNVHGDFYVDYSHGIRLVAPVCTVNGVTMETAAVYQHPTLSRLVNRQSVDRSDGPVRVPRYPAAVPPAPVRMASGATFPASQAVAYRPGFVPLSPDPTELALDDLARRNRG